MPSVQKLSDTSYNIVLSERDISAGYSGGDDGGDSSGTGTSGTVVNGVSVSVEFTPEVADTIRDKVSRELTFGLDFGDKLASNKFLHALYSSPVPFSGIYGTDAPALDNEDIEAISNALSNLPRSFTFQFGSVNIGNGDTYRLKFTPDARGFDVKLENTGVENILTSSHAFAISVPFTIVSLDTEHDAVEPGVASPSSSSSVEDAKVMFYNKDCEINGGEVLTRAIALSQRDRGAVIDAYNTLFSQSMWRSGGAGAVAPLGGRPYSDHLCGVDPSSTALQYLPLSGLTGTEQINSINLLFKGTANVSFLVGEIRYPFNPIFGATKTLFDICIDDPGWTDVGPLAEQYIGGTGTSGVDVIHSWTGRVGTYAKKATLASIGQSRLGG